MQGDLSNGASQVSQDHDFQGNAGKGIHLDRVTSVKVHYAQPADHEVADRYYIPKQYHLA